MRKKLAILLAVLLVIAAVLAALAHVYTEYLWFDHLGFGGVFRTRLVSQLGIGAAYGLVALIVLGVHILLIRRYSKARTTWTIPTAAGEVIDLKDVVRKVSTAVVVAAAIVVAAIMGYWASRHWEEVLKFFNQTSFGETEPILGKDIGFYLFALPVMQFTQEWVIYLTGIGAALSAIVYFARGAVTVKGRMVEMDTPVRNHLLFSLACVLGAVAWGWRLEMFETLFSKRGVAYGATYTDVNVNLIVYRIMVVACLACAAFFLYLMVTKPKNPQATKHPAYALVAVVGLYLLGSFAWPTVVQQFVVNPNELDKEKPYLAYAIAGTRHAYDLDKIETREFPALERLEDLTVNDLRENKPTIDNIKIWDHRPLKATYKQMQVIRLYYDFPSITVDRYRVDGKYWQVMLSAREMVPEQLPEQSQTWVNKHLQYTHGYGVCLSPVKSVVGEGLPDLWIKDIPPESRYKNLAVTRPEIYFGQQTSDYVLVNTSTKEFDYPKGSENVYNTYQGKAGIGVGTFFRRLLFAIRFTDYNLFFTSYLTPESRILIYRNIQERIAAVAPFLMLDQEPYMVVSDGRLLWVQDAYTMSYRYPYSQPTQLDRRGSKRINYIRNSVKVVVDAYNGTVDLYLWDAKDPMAQTYAKIFPSLFKPVSQMPAGVREHIRFPKDLFAIQAQMYESFHMTDPQIFYNQEDKWAVSKELGEKTIGRQREQAEQGQQTPGVTAKQVTSASRMDPYYMIMRLPREQREEYLLMVPFTPVNKDNMVAWMTARCDGDKYGKLLVYTFPKQKLVFGPMQIEARIDQDEYISQWITLRNQQGSIVIRGDLLVIPIKESLLYVEPIYLQSTQTQLPELKQVVVSFGKRLTMKETLQAALQEVFAIKDPRIAAALAGEKFLAAPLPTSHPSTQPVSTPTPPVAVLAPKDVQQLLKRALEHYKAAEQKVAKGDWAGYGAEQKALKKSLDDLAKKLQPQIQSAPRPR
jgi:uncharacterized protein